VSSTCLVDGSTFNKRGVPSTFHGKQEKQEAGPELKRALKNPHSVEKKRTAKLEYRDEGHHGTPGEKIEHLGISRGEGSQKGILGNRTGYRCHVSMTVCEG